ncbi:MAG: DHA2 family efflux MFS transporter permease subunit [Desulfobacterales bacterium]|nr:DHA2 family efflux MFS transporter permease subunit [Desulfobacterales bacterium]
MTISPAQRTAVITAALLALFLGALDALVMSAAMPTIVSELGGLSLYSWVYSSYFLARAVSLPIFGKLADLYPNRSLFIAAIALFVAASVAAGFAASMLALIVARVFQGIGAGGIFALVYVVLADVSPPESRGRTLSLASSVWGIASVLGPSLGGFIVTYFSWRWIFFINLPLGLTAIGVIGYGLVELRARKEKVTLDWAGVTCLTTAILAFLFALLLGGRGQAWLSTPILGLLFLSAASTSAFIVIEQRARDPILSIAFFRRRGFSTGNAAVFLSSFAIFSMFAFAPLFIQGVQGRSPMEVGLAMLALSLGWSLGSIALGQFIDRVGRKTTAIAGAVALLAGSVATLTLGPATSTFALFAVFFVIGIGMGWVSLSTLLVVQSCVAPQDLGVATSSNQFARTLGGAVGVGIGGSFFTPRLARLTDVLQASGGEGHWSASLAEGGRGTIESLLQPEVQAAMPMALRRMVQSAVQDGVADVFLTVIVAAGLCLLTCLLLPAEQKNA